MAAQTMNINPHRLQKLLEDKQALIETTMGLLQDLEDGKMDIRQEFLTHSKVINYLQSLVLADQSELKQVVDESNLL
jgi:hypothetical protein